MKKYRTIILGLLAMFLASSVLAYNNTALLNQRKRRPAYYNSSWAQHKSQRLALKHLELPLKGPGGNIEEPTSAPQIAQPDPTGVQTEEQPQAQTKRWEFTNPDGTPLSTIFFRYQNGEWHRTKIFEYLNGNEDMFRIQSYNKRLSNGSYDYDKIFYYNEDGVTINFIRKYNYDNKTLLLNSVDNYQGFLNNSCLTFTTYYDYDNSGSKYVVDTIYYSSKK